MPVQQQDILFYLTGGYFNVSPFDSTGGSIAQVGVPEDLNMLFDSINAIDHTSGNVVTEKTYDYRVVAMKIQNPLTDLSASDLSNASLFLDVTEIGDNDFAAFVSPTVDLPFTPGATSNDPPSQNGPLVFQTIPNTGLPLPTSVNPGDQVHIAIRRGISPGSFSGNGNVSFRVEGVTI